MSRVSYGLAGTREPGDEVLAVPATLREWAVRRGRAASGRLPQQPVPGAGFPEAMVRVISRNRKEPNTLGHGTCRVLGSVLDILPGAVPIVCGTGMAGSGPSGRPDAAWLGWDLRRGEAQEL